VHFFVQVKNPVVAPPDDAFFLFTSKRKKQRKGRPATCRFCNRFILSLAGFFCLRQPARLFLKTFLTLRQRRMGESNKPLYGVCLKLFAMQVSCDCCVDHSSMRGKSGFAFSIAEPGLSPPQRSFPSSIRSSGFSPRMVSIFSPVPGMKGATRRAVRRIDSRRL
jgi:hypothetical protein